MLMHQTPKRNRIRNGMATENKNSFQCELAALKNNLCSVCFMYKQISNVSWFSVVD